VPRYNNFSRSPTANGSASGKWLNPARADRRWNDEFGGQTDVCSQIAQLLKGQDKQSVLDIDEAEGYMQSGSWKQHSHALQKIT
jgi:hypothetical protein